MRSTIRLIAIFAALVLALVLQAGPAMADPVPSHTVSKTCAPNRITVVQITIADYPAGSVASIEGDPVPINTTTIVSITRAIVLDIDSSGTVGDIKDKIRPKPLCRWLP